MQYWTTNKNAYSVFLKKRYNLFSRAVKQADVYYFICDMINDVKLLEGRLNYAEKRDLKISRLLNFQNCFAYQKSIFPLALLSSQVKYFYELKT